MNKYINLIVSMQQTRGDWSQGFYRVKNSIDKFNIKNEEEQNIIATILKESYDCEDGRVFRDMKFNYDYLYEKYLTKEEQIECNNILTKYWKEY
jgi:hypothetical protein